MRTAFVIGALIGVAVFVREAPAAACGGCFHDPTDNPTVVTDHRMIFSLSQDQTTLYDQIKYSGSPASFAWVLPISGIATVGLSSDILFEALDSMTHTTVFAPSLSCPPPPCPLLNFADASASLDASAGGVDVLKQEVVGPYETVQLHSSDPTALNKWLTSHGFVIPSDVQPIIDSYIALGVDFLALKLAPGASVQSMRPVRVTTQGASLTLPLRMVSAGVGSNVGITLWILGEGRYEPQNFASFRIDDSELVWDFATQSSNYAALRQAKEQAGGNATWEIESSITLYQSQLTQIVDTGGTGFVYDYDAGADYPASSPSADAGDAGDASAETSVQLRDADLAALFHGLPDDLRVTRIRADLSRTALATDLNLQASADQSLLTNDRHAMSAENIPPCPTYPPCPDGGYGYGDGGDGFSNSNSSGCGVAATDSQSSVAALALVALHAIRRRRRVLNME